MPKTDKMVDEARRLYNMGFNLLWLYPRQKRPIGIGWTKGGRKSLEELLSAYKPGFNLGVRTGNTSLISGFGYLACIDVDIKDEACRDTAVKKLTELVGLESFPEVRSGGGNGSRHLYCVTRRPFKSVTIAKEPGWEIVVYGEGRQMVLPPSIHPSGAAYTWRVPIGEKSELPLFNLEEHERSFNKVVADGAPGKSHTTPKEIEIHAGAFAFKAVDVNLETLDGAVSRKVQDAITKGTGVEDRSAYLLIACNALLNAGLGRDEILSVLTDTRCFLGRVSYEHAQTKSRTAAAHWLWRYTLKEIMEKQDASLAFAREAVTKVLPDDEVEAQNAEIEGLRNWRQELKRTRGSDEAPGKIVDSLNNLDLILSNAVSQPLFKKDEFVNREFYGVDAPWGRKKGDEISDNDVALIKSWLATSEFAYEPKRESIEDAITLITYRNRFHPVREWLESLEWDGVKRIDSWLKDYLEAEGEEPYLTQVSRKFLVAMVTRVYRPGCHWDYTLILEGEQGSRKSTTARTLAGDKWFCDHLPDLKHSDAMLNLRGSWLVELAELRNVKHSDASTVKAFLTRRTDRVRPPYGKRWMDYARQSVFIGTVNEHDYFKDPTGNRRFWPVKIGRCDVERLSRDRGQLFAEAKAVFDKGEEELFLKGDAEIQALAAQDERRVDDDLSEIRGALEAFVRDPKEFNLSRFKLKELFEGPTAPLGEWKGKNYSIQNAAQALRMMGFQKTKVSGQSIWRDRPYEWQGPHKWRGNPGEDGDDPFRDFI